MAVTPEQLAENAAERLANARTQLHVATSVAREVARNLHSAGWSDYRISEALGVTRSTARSWIRT